jgi:hypothetical protein
MLWRSYPPLLSWETPRPRQVEAQSPRCPLPRQMRCKPGPQAVAPRVAAGTGFALRGDRSRAPGGVSSVGGDLFQRCHGDGSVGEGDGFSGRSLARARTLLVSRGLALGNSS